MLKAMATKPDEKLCSPPWTGTIIRLRFMALQGGDDDAEKCSSRMDVRRLLAQGGCIPDG